MDMKNDEPYFWNYFKKDIDKNNIIIFDTNVLLDMYLINPDDLKYLGNYFDSIKEHIWTPSQVYEEFINNRVNKLNSIRTMANELLKFNDNVSKQANNFLKKYEDFPDEYGEVLANITKNRMLGIEEYIFSLESKFKNLEKDVGKFNYDKNDKYFEIIKNKVFFNLGASYEKKELEVLYHEADKRYTQKIPPGYEDALKSDNKYGDFIIWKQMIEKSIKENKNIIFVSSDGKNNKKKDWRKNGECREELINEFHNLTGNQFELLYLNELIKRTTKSSENLKQCIYDIRECFNENISFFSQYDKKFLYLETLDRIFVDRKNEYNFSKNIDDIAYNKLKQFREIIEYVNRSIICGGIYMPRYALQMDVLVRDGELLELLCTVYYKANTCLIIGVEVDGKVFPIVREVDRKEIKNGYLNDILNKVLQLAYTKGTISEDCIEKIHTTLQSLYTKEELLSL